MRVVIDTFPATREKVARICRAITQKLALHFSPIFTAGKGHISYVFRVIPEKVNLFMNELRAAFIRESVSMIVRSESERRVEIAAL